MAETNIPPLLPVLLPPLTTILKSTPQDPTPLVSLTTKLLSPLPFTRALTLADPPSLAAALSSPLPGANLLACAVLHKAAATPGDAAILSTLPELVEALVRTWLETADVGVGERCSKVLGDILETDCDVVDEDPSQHVNGVNGTSALVKRRRTPGHGRIWQLFLTVPIITLLPTFCTPSSSRTLHQTTLSQGRLLRILPRLTTLNIHALTNHPSTTLFPLPERTAAEVGTGLLQWAALGMVDAEDVLMRLTLVDFFEALVSVVCAVQRDAERDGAVRKLVKTAMRQDGELEGALRGLPDRTIEDEAEALRGYISFILR